MFIEEADNTPCTAAAEVDPVAVTMELDIERMRNLLNKRRIETLKIHSANTETLLTKVNAQLEASQKEVARLEKVISDDKRPVIYVLYSEPYQHLSQPGWVVVDTTWKRGPLHLTEKAGWLGTASQTFPTTVFASEKDAQQAIADTKAFKGMSGRGDFAWQSNNYVAVEVHKQ